MLIADACVSVQTGDEALAGQEEKFQAHYFPPDQTKDRTIAFKGYYLSIQNDETGDYATHIDNINTSPTTEFSDYAVPKGYTTYVRVATAYFKV